MKKNIKIAITILIILLIILLILLFNLFNNKEKKDLVYLDFENRSKTLEKFESGTYFKDGWLQIQGTNIDLPILDQSALNDSINYSYGVYRFMPDDERIILAGHNVLNVSSHPIVTDPILKNFEPLMAFTYSDFAKANQYIQFTDDEGNEAIYVIYAIGFESYDYKYDLEPVTKNKKNDYIKYVRNHSIYDIDVNVDNNDELLTIITCSRYFGLTENQQFIINARKLRNNEKTYKNNVITNDNYKEMNKVNSKEAA